ncbi:rhodanese-like domain-containing protein [Actinophytocola sp.]|uniref:rhodanese-like domain-containing protein n=1 Tax=Actinophytocola sp. TaxID=1872138 RepID=UPI003D6B42E2
MTIPETHRDELAELVHHNQITHVEALPEEVYAEGHLPGTINIRPRHVDELAPTPLPDPHARIVVYCGSATCDASLRVAQHLHQLGYHNIHRYTAGKTRLDQRRPPRPSTDKTHLTVDLSHIRTDLTR